MRRRALSILELSGSVELALLLWVAGMAAYLEYGTAMLRNGGEVG